MSRSGQIARQRGEFQQVARVNGAGAGIEHEADHPTRAHRQALNPVPLRNIRLHHLDSFATVRAELTGDGGAGLEHRKPSEVSWF